MANPTDEAGVDQDTDCLVSRVFSDSPLPPNAEELVNLPVEEIFTGPAGRRQRHNVAERRAILLKDDLIETLEEERFKCAKCDKWVALQKGRPYALERWKKHRDGCPPKEWVFIVLSWLWRALTNSLA